MEIADKIRAEIQLHRAELERLETALSVIEQYGLAKPAKPAPLITVRRKIEAPKGKASNKGTGTPRKGTIGLKQLVLQMLHDNGGTITAKAVMSEAAKIGRADNSVYSAFDKLLKDGVVIRDAVGVYSLPGKPKPEATPRTEPGQTGGESEAA